MASDGGDQRAESGAERGAATGGDRATVTAAGVHPSST